MDVKDLFIVGKLKLRKEDIILLPYCEKALIKKLKNFFLLKKNNEIEKVNIKIKKIKEREIIIEIDKDKEKVNGATLFGDKKELPKLKDGFYVFELIGKKAYDSMNNFLGIVSNVIEYSSKVFIEIEKGKFLVPFENEFIKEINEHIIIFRERLPL